LGGVGGRTRQGHLGGRRVAAGTLPVVGPPPEWVAGGCGPVSPQFWPLWCGPVRMQAPRSVGWRVSTSVQGMLGPRLRKVLARSQLKGD